MSESIPPVIDFEALLAPIDGDTPAGENLRYEGTYDQLKEARREDEVLSQGDWSRDLKVADWPKVIQMATQALTTRTKDLQIAAWLAEGLARHEKVNRWAGLRDGLHLIRAVIEMFWDTAYPEIDPDDDEGPLAARANVLASLDTRLSSIIAELPLTAGAQYNFQHYKDAKQFDFPENTAALDYDQQEKINALRVQAEAEGKTTGEDWRKAKAASSFEFLDARLTLINECWDQLQALDAAMDQRFARETPGVGATRKALDEVRTLVELLVKEKRPAGEGADESAGVTEETGGGPRVTGGVVRSRQEALKRLSEVAEFFRQTEPHSPVSYLVQRAVKWGHMPLDAWLADVVKDGTTLDALREILGMNTYGQE